MTSRAVVDSQASTAPPKVEAVGLSKRFGSTQALSDVSVHLPPGHALAVLGENGAGKSTLVKCLMGTYEPDSGRVFVDGRELNLRDARDAEQAGLGMVYQHFTLVNNMSVVENMVLARGIVPAVIDWKDETARFHAFMERMPFRIDPTVDVRHLAVGEKQKLEILKQLYSDRKVIILDEPTSALAPREAEEVLGILHEWCRAGSLSMLLITHKLQEVAAYCDSVTVLRHGRTAGGGPVSELAKDQLIEMMVGSDPLPVPADRRTGVSFAKRPPHLAIHDLSVDNERGVEVVSGLSLTVHSAEIVGIAGVSGNGQRELVEVLAGQLHAQAGQVFAHGEPYRATRKQIERHAIRILPEMPLRNACLTHMTVAENIGLRWFDGRPFIRLKWLLRKRALAQHAQELITRFHVQPPLGTMRLSHLSGGNVQRAVLARELSGRVEILVAANPCFGLDIRAAADIRSQIVAARNRGAAVLLVSEDLDEIIELADRILVMSQGRIVYETSDLDVDRQQLGKMMAAPEPSTSTIQDE